MLEPDRRHLLLDTLRPPSGMTLDRAVGTTFSLDLEALLLAPVAFALFDARLAESDDPARTDPIAVMEAVRRYADRIDLFCQAGQISLPPRDKPILALLEDSVHPASAQSHAHIFHPKVWCLRFLGEDGTVSFRLLVLSRNLTFDRSWDTVVRLDGVPGTDEVEHNQPLAAFLTALPGLATRPLPDDRTGPIESLAEDIRTVTWELPDGFTDLHFCPSGVDGLRHEPLADSDRLLVISPFLTRQQLEKLAGSSKRTTLVSRPESLDLIHADVLDSFEEILVLAETTADFEPGTDKPVATDDPNPEQDLGPTTGAGSIEGTTEATGERPGSLSPGIHAKLFVTERGSTAELRSGSTNATTAGWGGNVEFDVALSGRRERCGVDAILGNDAPGTTLRTLLDTYRRTERAPLTVADDEQVAIKLERYGRELARMALTANVEPDGELYRIILRSDRPLPASDLARVRCWLVTRKPETAQSQTPGHPVHLSEGALSLQALSSFFAFEIGDAGGTVSIRVVMNARLVGAPEDRAERLLIEQLRNKGDVLRYLLFLLADLGDESAYELTTLLTSARDDSGGQWQGLQLPLLESMVRALSRNPGALGPIERLITDLSRTEEGRSLLPDGLDLVWPAIHEARSRLA